MMISSKSKSSRLCAALVTSVMLLSSCAGTNPIDDVTRVFTGIPAEEFEGMNSNQRKFARMAAEAERTRGIGLLGGAGVGALMGGLICERTLSLCTAGFATAGAAVGYFAGFYLAGLKENAENEQDGLRADIGAAEKALSEYKERSNLADKLYASNVRTIKKLNRRATASEAALASYAKQYRIIRQERDQVSAYASQASTDLRLMQLNSNGRAEFRKENTRGLDKRREALGKIVTRLEKRRDAYDALLEDVPQEVKDAADE